MKSVHRVGFLSILLLILTASANLFGQTTTTVAPPTGKPPIIIIPGVTGSDLFNRKTGEEVWFKSRRAKDDDLRLPISADLSRNRDDLISRDILRSVKFLKFLPETEIYERLIDALQTRGGYREAKWTTATRNDAADTFYVFPFDWRRDNVENAQLLIRRIETLKRRLGKPDLKFNVIAHSMGGLITRYAAMYGRADLSPNPRASWAGARHFNKIFLLGTPNEGSVSALDSLLNGFSYIGGGLNLPFIQNINRFDTFTIPSLYQLLPSGDALLAYDENLKPVAMDIYDPATWEKYNWAVWQDNDFAKKFNAIEQRNARPFLNAVLRRAKLFRLALNAGTNGRVPVSIYLMGADCKDTPAAMLLLRDEKKARWVTRFKAGGFTRSDGGKVEDAILKPLIFALGDGVVTKRSLDAVASQLGAPVAGELYQCVEHNKLVTSAEVQDKLLSLLNPLTASHASQ
jgi:pimeloyl-ACP methyl ester carboxylesterase